MIDYIELAGVETPCLFSHFAQKQFEQETGLTFIELLQKLQELGEEAGESEKTTKALDFVDQHGISILAHAIWGGVKAANFSGQSIHPTWENCTVEKAKEAIEMTLNTTQIMSYAMVALRAVGLQQNPKDNPEKKNQIPG